MGPVAGSGKAAGFGMTQEGRKSRTGSGKAVESRGPSAVVSLETSTAPGLEGPAEGRLSVPGPEGTSDDTGFPEIASWIWEGNYCIQGRVILVNDS